MNTIEAMLNEYNRRAAFIGKPARAKWHASKAKLAEAIDAMPASKPFIRKHSTSDVGAYFRDHGLNAKCARARLRKLGMSAPYTLAQLKATFES